MSVKSLIVGFVTALVLIAAAGLIVRGAPLERVVLRPADPIRSLEGIKRIQLDVRPLPAQLKSRGLSVESIEQDWRGKLEGAGFEVTGPARGVPVLDVRIAVDEGENDSFAVSLYLLLHQDVQVKRLKKDLVVPTYTHALQGLETTKSLQKSMEDAMDYLVRSFIGNCRKAERTKD